MQDKQPLILYIVRHGQTIFNLMDKVQGISDAVLTQGGIEGAVNLGRGLRDINFGAVYSSDLARAYETARIAMSQNTATQNWNIKIMQELREVSFGNFEGDPNCMMYRAFGKDLGIDIPDSARDIASSAAPIVQHYAQHNGKNRMLFLEELANFNKRIDRYGIAENAEEVYARLQRGIDTILKENPNGGNIMLVAHGQLINFLFAELKLNAPAGPLGNSSVTKVRYEKGVFCADGPFGDMSYAEAGAKRS